MKLALCAVHFRMQEVPCPTGTAYEFVKELASAADEVSENYAVERYSRSELEMKADSFLQGKKFTQEQANEVRSWIASLPWDEQGHISLHFDMKPLQ